MSHAGNYCADCRFPHRARGGDTIGVGGGGEVRHAVGNRAGVGYHRVGGDYTMGGGWGTREHICMYIYIWYPPHLSTFSVGFKAHWGGEGQLSSGFSNGSAIVIICSVGVGVAVAVAGACACAGAGAVAVAGAGTAAAAGAGAVAVAGAGAAAAVAVAVAAPNMCAVLNQNNR